jgi:hypothetical protein
MIAGSFAELLDLPDDRAAGFLSTGRRHQQADSHPKTNPRRKADRAGDDTLVMAVKGPSGSEIEGSIFIVF